MTKSFVEVEVSETKSDRWSTAPNGSACSHDFYTVVISRQDWTEGAYAGRSYRITQTFISNRAETRGQLISSSSTPWVD